MKATLKAMIPALALVGVLLLAPAAQANDRHGNHGYYHGNHGYYSHGYSHGHGHGYYAPYRYYGTPYRYYRPYAPYYYAPYGYAPYGYAPPYAYGYPAPVPFRPGVHVGIGLSFGF